MKQCNFCKTYEKEGNPIIESNNTFICRSCAEVSLILTDNAPLGDYKELEQKPKAKILSPLEYKSILDEYVIGQDSAKKVLSVGIYNHLLRLESEIQLPKNNVLFIGPSGTGKTFLAETISKHLDIPLAIVNTTSLTAAGYIGEDVTSVLERLWKDAGEDIEKAQKGIIFLDEVDKIATAGGGTNNKDVSGKAVQQELLKILEGDKVKIYPEGSSKNRKSGTPIEIKTNDILFIAGGAFVGLKDKAGVQLSGLGSSKKEEHISNGKMQTLLNDFGLIPEFYGRFSNIVQLEELSIKSMENIMTKPKNNIIGQYTSLFMKSEVEVQFTKKFIDKVAKDSLDIKTGARGLKTIMEDLLTDFMFNISEYKGESVKIDYSYNEVKIKNGIWIYNRRESWT